MSALGRHRDSFVNLAALAHHHTEESSNNKYIIHGAEAGDEAFYIGDDETFDIAVDDDEGRFDELITNPDVDIEQSQNSLPPPKHGQQFPKKSILKTTKKKKVDLPRPRGSHKQQQTRRTIFSSVPEKISETTSATQKVTFAEKRKIFIMPSLDPFKDEIWWDPKDYVSFKRTAVFLAKSIPTDGAESWLHENNTSGSPASIPGTEDFIPEEKWWCKFGHSRRGLEHLCCEKEGNARQRKVVEATHAVLDEQDHNKTRGKVVDPSTLARISGRHTKWARDLALAAGFADAKAVATDFDETLKIHRNHYIKNNMFQM